VVNGKVTGHNFTEPVKLMLRIIKSIANSRKKVDIDLKLLRFYQI